MILIIKLKTNLLKYLSFFIYFILFYLFCWVLQLLSYKRLKMWYTEHHKQKEKI